MKRFLSLVLCVAMIATAILSISAVTAAEVANGECGSTLTWSLDDEGTLTISGEGYMYSYTDTEPAPWASYAADIKKVVIGDDIISVGAYAFAGCTALESVVFTAGYHPYVPATEFVEGTAYKLMSFNNMGTIYADWLSSGSLTTVVNPADALDIFVEPAKTLDGEPAYRMYYVYKEANSYFYLSSNKTNTIRYTNTVPLYNNDVEVSTVWTYDEDYGAWLCPAYNNRYLSTQTTRNDIRCYAYADISKTVNNIAKLAVKDTTKTEIDGILEIGANAFDGCTALANLYCKSTEEAWASAYINAGNDVLATATVTYNYTEDDNEGGDDVVTAPEAIELTADSIYKLHSEISAIAVKPSSKNGETVDAFMLNIATEPIFINVIDIDGALVTDTTMKIKTGFKVQLLDNYGDVTLEYAIVLVGDSDENGRFAAKDVLGIKSMLSNKPAKDTLEFIKVDIDGNGKFLAKDIIALKSFIANGTW